MVTLRPKGALSGGGGEEGGRRWAVVLNAGHHRNSHVAGAKLDGGQNGIFRPQRVIPAAYFYLDGVATLGVCKYGR